MSKVTTKVDTVFRSVICKEEADERVMFLVRGHVLGQTVTNRGTLDAIEPGCDYPMDKHELKGLWERLLKFYAHRCLEALYSEGGYNRGSSL